MFFTGQSKKYSPAAALTAAAALIALAVSFVSCSAGPPPTLQPKTKLSPPFTLINQEGQSISLSQLRGKIVLLTFLYTNCPDACPLVFDKITKAAGNTMNNDDVTVAIITVDPERDTVARLKEYTAALPTGWQYLTSNREYLQTIWTDYGIVVHPVQQRATGKGYDISHTVKLQVIDKEGYTRFTFSGDKWQEKDLETILEQLTLE